MKEETNMSGFKSVDEIIKQHPMEVQRSQYFGYIRGDSKFYEALYEFYQDEMPYGVQKARDGDPEEWIENKLDDIGFFDNPRQGRY